ncbi:iron-sulfur cluster assembly accessory protein [Gloeocapsa sp. PCC 73106]|uniref:HesB/IscA family protein n=1 Tax=Gloeocapsa sp. PCC 73106 TaxID=102232 RepID=UPI0002AC74CC|nr:iron-sulfur cluster assembly accessory protein [Gloeocapsa sp. PCC 73106]ELR96227.1 Iron-sulfur cluster assembly accessory protein [Gloeocapsa sp. PCC 73106]
MLKITPSAAQEIKRLQANAEMTDSWVCLNVKLGGCCGLTYNFELVEHGEGETVESEGVKIAIAPEHQAYLKNLKIDYAEDLMGGGFRFDNPRAIATCSCSQSFSVDP